MRVLNVVDTVFELYYLSSVGYLLQHARPDVSLRLAATPRAAAKLNQELESLYSDIQIFECSGISFRPARDIVTSLRCWRKLGQLDLRADIVCISSFCEYFANILCRHLCGGPRLVALRMCNYDVQRLYQTKKTLLSFYLNAFNRLFGASTLEYRWSSNTTLNVAYWFKHNPYHRTICISDWGYGQNGSEFRLPPPFIALRQLYGVNDHVDLQQEPTILVAGERTPLFGMGEPSIQSLYDSVFDFLRQEFAGYRLLFKPRAGLTDIQRVKLDGFEILSPKIPFEELCLRNSYSKVISVKSTACKVAAYFGQPAYLLYPMFDLPSSLRQVLDAYHADMQQVIKVYDLSELLNDPPPVPRLDIHELSKLYRQAVMEGADEVCHP